MNENTTFELCNIKYKKITSLKNILARIVVIMDLGTTDSSTN